MLLLAPYVLHLLWAAAGAYLFGRLAVGMHRAGAFVTGLIYALWPSSTLRYWWHTRGPRLDRDFSLV